jgi:lysophospholipid acyltransferase (LPLAT)-like uncharacterized protein
MDNRLATRQPVKAAAKKKPRHGRLKTAWIETREALAQSSIAKTAVASLLARALRVVYRTNRLAEGSDDLEAILVKSAPVIIALWHGQHLLTPCVRPRHRPVTAMVSRSNDAELNALLLEKLGFESARGSGGRGAKHDRDKGGARALVALKKALGAGNNAAMIADIHGKPRQAGLGIVTLARISGRPILPLAVTTSRRKVIERSWDKTTINLPFGRVAVTAGKLISVAADADEDEMEARRRELTETLNDATERAYRLADGAR